MRSDSMSKAVMKMMSNITMTFAGFYYMAGVFSGILVTFLAILLMRDGKDKEREGKENE